MMAREARVIADLEAELGNSGAVGQLEGVANGLASLAALDRSRPIETQTPQAVGDPQQAQDHQCVQGDGDLEQRLPGNGLREEQQDGGSQDDGPTSECPHLASPTAVGEELQRHRAARTPGTGMLLRASSTTISLAKSFMREAGLMMIRCPSAGSAISLMSSGVT